MRTVPQNTAKTATKSSFPLITLAILQLSQGVIF